MKFILLPCLFLLAGCPVRTFKKSINTYGHECFDLALEKGYPDYEIDWSDNVVICYGTNNMKAEKLAIFTRE